MPQKAYKQEVLVEGSPEYEARAGQLVSSFSGQSFSVERQDYLMEYVCKTECETLEKYDRTIRVSVMVASRFTYHSQSDPIGYIKKGFKIRLSHKFQKDDPDINLRLLCGQGVAGAAFSSGSWAIGDRATNSITMQKGDMIKGIDHNFDEVQRSKVGHLKFICSYPIKKLERRGGRALPIGKVIGVINIDSSEKTLKDFEQSGILQHLLGETKPDGTKKQGRMSDLADAVAYLLTE
ncbi:MAG TPA: hypothetical protein PK668_26560 [Myxococcota bacterium]|nr:hypothetical protein [Myxococcota bacterium]HRY97091.1 hypothetical protein [Myxococcota bacterium]